MLQLEKEEDIKKNADETLVAIQKEIRIQQRTARARPQGSLSPSLSFLLLRLIKFILGVCSRCLSLSLMHFMSDVIQELKNKISEAKEKEKEKQAAEMPEEVHLPFFFFSSIFFLFFDDSLM